MAQSDVLLTVGLDTSKLNAQLAKLKSQLGMSMGKTLTDPINRAAAATDKFDKTLKGPIDSLRKVGNEQNRVNNIYEKAGRALKTLTNHEKELGRSKATLQARQRILDNLHREGIITTEQHGNATRLFGEDMRMLAKASGGVIAKFTAMAADMAVWAIGWTILYAAIHAVFAVLRSGFTAFVQIEAAMARIATVTTTTNKTLERTTDIQKKLIFATANKLPTTIEATSEALFKLSTASLDAYEASAALNPVMKLTVATAKDLTNQTELAGQTAKIVAGIYNTYGDQLGENLTPAEKFAKISNVLFKTFSKQQVELEELTQGLTYSVGVASQAKIPFEELAAILGVLNTQMQKSGRAGRGFQRDLSVMLKETEKIARNFGLAFDPEKPLNFMEVLTEMKRQIDAQAGSVESLGAVYDTFGLRGAPNLLALIQGFDKLQEQIKLNKSSVDLLGKGVVLRTQTIQAQFLLLKNTFHETMTSLLDFYGPGINGVLQVVRGVLMIINAELLVTMAIVQTLETLWEKMGHAAYSGLLRIRQGLEFAAGNKEAANAFGALAEEENKMATDLGEFQDIWKGTIAEITEDIESLVDSLKEGTTLDKGKLDKALEMEEAINSEHKMRIKEIKEAHRIRMLELAGMDKQRLLLEQIAWTEQNVIDVREKERKLLELNNELIEEQLQAWLDIVNVVTDNLKQGIIDFTKGVGDINNVLTSISDAFVKMALDKIVQKILFEPILDVSVNNFGTHVETFSNAVNRLGGFVATGGGGIGGGSVLGAITGGAGSAAAFAALMAQKQSGGSTGKITGGAGSAAAFAKQMAAKDAAKKDFWKFKDQGTIGNTLGALGIASAGYGAYQAGVQGGPAAGALSGVLGGAMAGLAFGGVGAIVGGAIGGIAGLIGGFKKTKTTDIQEQTDTIRIANKIDITNRELRILNRNMVGLRRGFEGWVMQESYYLRQRASAGLQDQPFVFAVNTKRGYQT